MTTTTIVIIIVIVVLALGAAAAAAAMQRRKRSSELQDRFGSEYDRTVSEAESRRQAEKELQEREKRRGEFEVTPLPPSSAAAYREEWDDIQKRFVDDPPDAVQSADRLVVRMMRESGYPLDDFDKRVADISVDHPDVAQHYREAHGVAVAQSQGRADTEQLRRAVTSYRQLVEALLRDSASNNETRPRTTD